MGQNDPVEDADGLQADSARFEVLEFVLLNDRADFQAYRSLAAQLLLGCRVLSIEPGEQDLLRGCPGRDQGNDAVRAKGILPKVLAINCPVHDNEDLAACRCDLHSEPPEALVPVDLICCLWLQVIDQRLRQLERRHVARFPMLPAAHIGNAANETPGTA